MENCMEGETPDYLMDEEEDYEEEEDEEERAARAAFQRRLRSTSTPNIIRGPAQPMSFDGDGYDFDEEMAEPDATEHSQPIKIPIEAIKVLNIRKTENCLKWQKLTSFKVARYYNWLKYEFQHEHSHIHMSPVFDDARHSFDMEHNSVVGVHDHFIDIDIQDEYFFPITTGTEVKS
jgi:hypothetical protein